MIDLLKFTSNKMILRGVVILVCNLINFQPNFVPKVIRLRIQKYKKNSNFEKVPTAKSLRTWKRLTGEAKDISCSLDEGVDVPISKNCSSSIKVTAMIK